LVAVDLWYKVGSKNEWQGKSGFAHLFEHMMFQGSENVGKAQHRRLISYVGE
jgi:zinc protease